MQDEKTMATGLGRALLTSKLAQVCEVVVEFLNMEPKEGLK